MENFFKEYSSKSMGKANFNMTFNADIENLIFLNLRSSFDVRIISIF